jgi:integrase/recombinase XerD
MNDLAVHHEKTALPSLIAGAGERAAWLFVEFLRRDEKLAAGTMLRTDVWYLVWLGGLGTGIATAICCHAFRTPGITD